MKSNKKCLNLIELILFLLFAAGFPLFAIEPKLMDSTPQAAARLSAELAESTVHKKQYLLLLKLAEYGPEAVVAFPNVKKLLTSPEPMVKMAALRVFISAMQPYPEAVPELVKILRLYPRNRDQDSLRGAAAAALAEVCNDPAVFRKLLQATDKSLKQTITAAVRDKPALEKQLRPLLEWPLPEIKGKSKSVIINGDFESGNQLPNGWELVCREGAEGSVKLDTGIRHSGKQSLLLKKDNGKGYLELRSQSMVTVPPKAFWTWRGFYHADNAPSGSLLLFRLEDENGQVSSHDKVPRSGWAWQSQSFLLNAEPGKWRKRLLMLAPSPKARKFRLLVRIYGNPCKVWMDDLTFPSAPWTMHIASQVPEAPRYSWEQASSILAKRKDASGKLLTGANRQVELQINGKTTAPVIYFPWKSEYGDYDQFEKAGVKICNVVLPINDYYGNFSNGDISQQGTGPVWSSATLRRYNFEPLFSKLRDFIRKAPDAYLVLGFHISWPGDYVKINPETAWQDEKGRYAYGNSGFLLGFKPADKIAAPLLRWPSPYCDKPFEDVAEVLKAFIRELRKTDISKCVIGCFVSGGHDGQFEIIHHDFGPNGRNAWHKWLKARYKTDSALQRAWSRKDAAIATAPVPVNSHARSKDPAGSPVFYSPRLEQADQDYSLFRQERIWHLKEYLTKAIKNEFDKPLLGAVWLMGGFHAKYVRPFLNSKYLDIAIIQPTYQHRMPGMLSGSGIPFESLREHNKMVFKELDFRSWLRETYHNELGSMKIGTPEDIAAFRSTSRKEIGQMIASGAGGWWYYDISQNAFNHPEILKEIKRSVEISRQVDKQKIKFRPDVVVVMNHSAPTATRLKIWGFRNEANWFLQYQVYALKLSGVPFDTCFLEDIRNNPELQKYRMYIFINPYQLNSEEVSFINKKLKKNGNVLVWHFAPGYLNPDQQKYDIDQVSTLTGIRSTTSMRPRNYRIFAIPGQTDLLPAQGLGSAFKACFGVSIKSSAMSTQRFVINDPAACPLTAYSNGETAIAYRKMPQWTSVYVAALAGLSGELMHKLAIEHGLYALCPPNIAQTEMNASFISINPVQNGTLELNLPRKCTAVDAFNGSEIGKDTKKVKLDLTAGNSRWLLLK